MVSDIGADPYPGPLYQDDYQAALDAAGISYDVYDVDANGRTAASALGVLSHYKAVIWETGEDIYVREPGQPGGSGTSKLLDDEILGIRDYLNNGGKALVAGKFALQGGWDQFLFNPLGAPPAPFCKSNQVDPSGNDDPAGQLANCVAVSNDFQQYWLGRLPADRGGRRQRHGGGAAVPGGRRALRQRGIHGQRRGLRGESGQHLLVPDDVEHPAGRHLPAVREPAGDQDRPPAVVRPADGHALRVLAGGRRQLTSGCRGRST